MHSDNGEPTAPDLSAILEGLANAGVEFILAGGLAAVIQGAPVTTLDCDIRYNRSTENISRLDGYLQSVSAVYRRPDDKIIRPDKAVFEKSGRVLLKTCLGPLDVLSFIEDKKTYEDLIEHTVKIKFRGHKIRVLDLQMMVKLKKTSKDPKDRRRLSVLEETLSQLKAASEGTKL
jgi:hypothetical protein